MKSKQHAIVWVLALSTALGQALPQLEVKVVEGAGAVVPHGVVSARRLAVEVTEGGKPVAGAAVSFKLPPGEVTGRFASGFQTETVLTGADGRASVYGVRWGDQPGELQVAVTAVAGGRRASASIPVEISSNLTMTRADRATNEKVTTPGSGSKKWWIIAGVAGGALAGVAFAGMGKSGPAPVAVFQPAVVTPSIGLPSISVGKP